MDSHGDFNTPETTLSGFLDGMALAAATGRCWQNLTSSVAGFRPVCEENVILIGARDLDPEERKLLEGSAISWIQTATVRERGAKNALAHALEGLKADQIYLHIDLDVLDRSAANVNRFSSAGGLTVTELLQTVRVVAAARAVVAAAITAYDPSYDNDGKALRAGMELIKELSSIDQPS
jgi:arginase